MFCLKWIQDRKWKQFRKELAATIFGARVYHTCKARNWKLFKATTVKIEVATAQIKKEMIERLDLLGGSEKARKYTSLVQRICT